MAIGLVQCAIVAFPGNKFKGEIIPALNELVASGTVRILDVAFVKKDADGRVDALEVSSLSDEEAAGFDDVEGEPTGLLSDEDLQHAGELLEPDSSAGLILWENVWSANFVRAVRNADGRLLALERIPADVIEAALTENATVREVTVTAVSGD
jgi:uncharacterized membrane protein